MKLHAAFLLAGLLTGALVQAATPVGAWTGRFQVPIPTLPANLPPAQKAMAAKMIAQIKNGRIYLVIKPDHTYTTRMVAMPSLGTNSKGTWSQKGNVVSMQETKPGVKPQPFALSADGKTMSFPMPGGHGRMVFVR